MSKLSWHIVSPDEAGQRLDALLAWLPQIGSRSAAAKLIEAGDVTVDGAAVAKKYLARAGERIAFVLPEQAGDYQPQAENIPLDIVYEDDYLLLINKQIDLCCHPSTSHETGTLVNALLYHCGAEHLSSFQGSERLGLVHRLDKDTSGLMLAAKDDDSARALQEAIQAKDVDRRYIALVHGLIAPDSGLIDAPLARCRAERLKMEVSDSANAREAVTTFRVLQRFSPNKGDDGFSLLECKLHTGRTHQIRAHMEYIKHPCVGDPLYAFRHERYSCELQRQFLHSYFISFKHPQSGECLTYVQGLPEDLSSALERIQDRSMGVTSAGADVLAALGK